MRKKDMMGQPPSRLERPPTRMVTKARMMTASSTTANDMRKPTLRHMEQK